MEHCKRRCKCKKWVCIYTHVLILVPFYKRLMLCLFALGFFPPTRDFFTRMETSPLPVKGCKFWPMLDTHGHEQWGFFSVPHILWHGASVYNGHLRGPIKLTLLPSVWQWSCHRSVAPGICTPNFDMQG